MSQKSAVKNSSRVLRAGELWVLPLVLGGVLAVLFWRSFHPAWVQFANDGPLQKAAMQAGPCAPYIEKFTREDHPLLGGGAQFIPPRTQ